VISAETALVTIRGVDSKGAGKAVLAMQGVEIVLERNVAYFGMK
jgi:hypothetical protein